MEMTTTPGMKVRTCGGEGVGGVGGCEAVLEGALVQVAG